MTKNLPYLLTIRQVAEELKWVTQGQLRAWLFNDYNNFVSQVVVRAGRKVLIDVQALHDWLYKLNGKTIEKTKTNSDTRYV